MGSGIAQVAAQGGYEVVLEDVREDLVKAGLEKVRKRLEKMVSDGQLEDRR